MKLRKLAQVVLPRRRAIDRLFFRATFRALEVSENFFAEKTFYLWKTHKDGLHQERYFLYRNLAGSLHPALHFV